MSERASPLERWLRAILLTGSGVSLTLILLGLLWQWAAGDGRLDYRLSGMTLSQLTSHVLRALTRRPREPEGLIEAGLVVLLFTPFVRVLVATLYFAMAARSIRYAVCSGTVLAILTFALFLK